MSSSGGSYSSGTGKEHNIKHKSAEDIKNSKIQAVVKKLGGQKEADEILDKWKDHQQAEKTSDRRKKEADGFLRGIIISHGLSRLEAMKFFKVGRHRFDRLRDLNPLLPVPKKRPAAHRVTVEDKELVRLYMKAQAVEPGYPCHHRSTPLYLEDPTITMSSLHKYYKLECMDRGVRVLSYSTFRKVVLFIMPTLHLGRTKTDTCNSCFSLDLQIKDPETSYSLKQELIAAKRIHLADAINARKAINEYVKSVKNDVAPNDPPLPEEPVYVPTCFKDPFDRLNRPFVRDHVDGTIGEDDDAQDNALSDAFLEFNSDESDSEEGQEEKSKEPAVDKERKRKMRVSIQDFGSGVPLPYYGANQPNHDYYASNLTLHNMNFVDPATGNCDIYYYDERQSGKDGNSVSSLRWNNIKQFILRDRVNIPTSECKVMDNCVGQNKSNTTHKLSMLFSLLLFENGVTDIYFRVGHSHNQSDMKTAHANKGLAKKNLFTPQAVVVEVNKIKGLTAQVLDERDGVFLDWKPFLDKHFPNMDPGFTSFYIFEFKNGKVEYKELSDAGIAGTVKTKVFCADPVGTRKIILRELFNLSSTSSVVEICKARPRLPPLQIKRISPKKIENMKVIYQQIPRSCRWFYPEGITVQDESFTDLRARAVQRVHDDVDPHVGVGVEGAGGAQAHSSLIGLQDELAGDVMFVDVGRVDVDITPEASKRKVGRPKTIPTAQSNQPAIHRFFAPEDINNRSKQDKRVEDSNNNSDENVVSNSIEEEEDLDRVNEKEV